MRLLHCSFHHVACGATLLTLLLGGCGGSSSQSKSATDAASQPATAEDLNKHSANIGKSKDQAPATGATSTAAEALAAAAGSDLVAGLSGPIAEPGPAAPGPLPATSAEAKANVAKALRVAGFMATYPLSAADQHNLQANLLRDYEEDKPNYAPVLDLYKGIMRTSRDPIASAELRVSYFRWFGPVVAANPRQYRTGLWGMVQKYNPVLLVHNGRVVTKLGVHDRLATASLLARTANVPMRDQRPEAAVVADGCRAAVRDFASLPDSEQMALVRGESEYCGIRKMVEAKSVGGRSAVAWLKVNLRREDDLMRLHPQVLARAVAFDKGQTSAEMASFRAEMRGMMKASNDITRMSILANENTQLQSRPSATK